MKFARLARIIQYIAVGKEKNVQVKFNLEDDKSPCTDLNTIYLPKSWENCTVKKDYEDYVTSALCHETFHISFCTSPLDSQKYKATVENVKTTLPPYTLWFACLDCLLNIHDDSQGFKRFKHLPRIYKASYDHLLPRIHEKYNPEDAGSVLGMCLFYADVFYKGIYKEDELPLQEIVDVIRSDELKLIFSMAKIETLSVADFNVLTKDLNPLDILGLTGLGMLSIVLAKRLIAKLQEQNKQGKGAGGGIVSAGDLASFMDGSKEFPIGTFILLSDDAAGGSGQSGMAGKGPKRANSQGGGYTKFGIEMISSAAFSEVFIDPEALYNVIRQMMKSRMTQREGYKLNTRNLHWIESDPMRIFEGREMVKTIDEKWKIYVVIDASGSMDSRFDGGKETLLEIVKTVGLQIYDTIERIKHDFAVKHDCEAIIYSNNAFKLSFDSKEFKKLGTIGGTNPESAMTFIKSLISDTRPTHTVVIFLSDGCFSDQDAKDVIKIYNELNVVRKCFIPVLLGRFQQNPNFKYQAETKQDIEHLLCQSIVDGYVDLL